MQGQEDDIDRHGRFQSIEQLVAQAFIDSADGGAGWLGEGVKAEDIIPTAFLTATAEDIKGSAEATEIGIRIKIGGPDNLEVGDTGGHGREGIGLGFDTAGEHSHWRGSDRMAFPRL